MHKPRISALRPLAETYAGLKVLVVGADGFLGVNCVHALQALGADVSVFSRRERPRAEDFRGRVFRGDLRDSESLGAAVRGQEIVFDLAGFCGPMHSNQVPVESLDEECRPHLNLFKACAESKPSPVLVFSSSRLVYGSPRYLPVDESHPLQPQSMYAVHKVALESYLHVFERTHALRSCVLRLSNPYGPYPAQGRKDHGVINQFIHKALRGEPIELFGTGDQERDYIHVDDALIAFLTCAVSRGCCGAVFNLGARQPISLAHAAQEISRLTGGVPVRYLPWPAEYSSIETGSYRSDLSKLERCVCLPEQLSFSAGLEQTLRDMKHPVNSRANGTLSIDSPGPPPTRAVAERSGEPITILPAQRRPERRSTLAGKRILITGAGGFIGSHLVRRLLGEGARVAALSRNEVRRLEGLEGSCEIVPCDLTDASETMRAITSFGPEILYHFASHPDGAEDVDQARSALLANTLGTLNALDAFHECGGSSFLYGDSCKVYGARPVPHGEDTPLDPLGSYAISKAAGWNLCRLEGRLHGFSVVSLRPTMIFGPGQRGNLISYVIDCVRNGQVEIHLDGGSQTRDPLFIEDAIDAFVAAGERGRACNGRVINLSGGHEITVLRLANLVLELMGSHVPVVCDARRARPTEMWRSSCDNVLADRLLGLAPRTDLRRGLRATISSVVVPTHVSTPHIA